MRYFSNSLTITELSKSEMTVESTGLALLSKYILQVIGHFNMKPPHFVQTFDFVYFPLSFRFLGLLNDLHINAISLQRGYSKDIAIYIDDYGKYETIPFGIIQRLIQSSKSHLHFRISNQFAHNNQL